MIPGLLLRQKPPDPETNLERVDAGVEVGQSSVGDVHIARLDAPVTPVPEQMYTKHTAGRKVHGVGTGRNVVAGEKRSAVQFEVGDYATPRGKIPLEVNGVEAHSVRCVGRLKDEKHRHCVNRVFEPAFKETGAVRPGQNPSVAQAKIPHARVLRPPGYGVAAPRPYLDFAASVLRTLLGESQWSAEQQVNQKTWQEDDASKVEYGWRGRGWHGIRTPKSSQYKKPKALTNLSFLGHAVPEGSAAGLRRR